jgi:leucyl-tRNA synthetase
MWEHLGHKNTITYEKWPDFNEEFIKVDEVEILVQVLGKPKARIVMPMNADENTMRSIAMQNDAVKTALAGKEIRKLICVPNRLMNIVV